MKSYLIVELKDRFKTLGFTWQPNMLIGVRSKEDKPNEFDDKFYYFDGAKIFEYSGTTNPGTSWLLKWMNPKGTAVLAARQYIDTWKLGLHKGAEAMVQAKTVCVYRDNNKDLKSDEIGTPEWGWYAINIHRANASAVSTFINTWSAGCQVFNDPVQHADFIKRFKISGKKTLTYTLLMEF